MVATAYQRFVQEYQDSKQLSFRKHIEAHTLFRLAGRFHGLRVLDLACGEGFYTRQMKEAGAAIVIGVDVCAQMVKLAEETEQSNPVGIHYIVRDAAQMSRVGTFDLVTAMYLMGRAKTEEELLDFCRAAYQQLAPGGRFIGCNENVTMDPANCGDYQKYGFIKGSKPNRQEGDPISYAFCNPDGTVFKLDNFYLKPETYEAAFKEAGFSEFRWAGPYLAPNQRNNPYWDDFMENPPIIGFVARKTY